MIRKFSNKRSFNNCACSIVVFVVFLVTSKSVYAQQFINEAADYGVTAIITTHQFGSGVSTFDFDKDGWDDLTMSNDNGPIIIYRNTGSGFASVNYGINATAQTKMVLWADYDNDGLNDLLVTSYGGRNVLYKNMGNLVFEDYTEAAGLPLIAGNNSGASFGDYDRDGFLDLYICSYENNNLSPPVSPATHNRLYHNNGDGTFTDVTLEAGVENTPHLSLQSVWTDVNNDSWPDLHVINDRLPANFLYLNNGDGTFDDVTIAYNMAYPNNCVMTNSVSDFDHDGDLDIYMTNNGGFNTPSRLARNEDMQYFIESAAQYGLDLHLFAWGGTWIDGNNDTWDDLLVVLPYAERARYYNSQFGEFFNDDETAIEVAQDYTCYSPAKGDFNHDGYPDVFIQATSPNPPMLLMNTGGSKNSINITLNGTVSNKGAIGSWIRVYVDGDELIKYTMCGENYHGQNSQHEHFGMAGNTMVDSISIKYPSGHTDVYRDTLVVNYAYSFTEGETYKAEIETNTGLNSICMGDSIELSVIDEHFSIQWSTGDTIPSIWVSAAGIYTLSVENEYGIVQTKSVEIFINPIPTITSIITTPLCHGDSMGSIELINQNQTPISSVEWNNGDQGYFIDSLTAGVYDYILLDTNGCSVANSINILEPSAMQFFATSTPEMDQNQNGSISINVFGGSAPYQIYLDTMLVGTQIDSLTTGEYTFTIFDSNMCSGTITIQVDFVTNVNAYNEIQIDLYPNPVSNELTIESDQLIEDVSVLNISGQIVKQFKQTQNNKYTFSDLPNGVYIIHISLLNKGIGVYKIVKT